MFTVLHVQYETKQNGCKNCPWFFQISVFLYAAPAGTSERSHTAKSASDKSALLQQYIFH